MPITKKYLKQKFPGNHAIHELIDYIKPGKYGSKWHHVTGALSPAENLGASGDYAMVTFAGKIYIFNKKINPATGVAEWVFVADLTPVAGGGGGGSVITPFTEIPAGEINGVNLTFYLSKEPISINHIRHFLTGNRLIENLHYTQYPDHFTIIPSDFMPIPSGADTLVSEYYIYVPGARPVYGEVPGAGVIDGVNIHFQLAHIPVAHSLFLTGNRLIENLHYSLSGDIFEIIPSDFMPIPSGTDTLVSDYHY